MEPLNTEVLRTWAPLKGSHRLARIHEALSLKPSSPRDDCSIATELSLTTEMVGGLDTLVYPGSNTLFLLGGHDAAGVNNLPLNDTGNGAQVYAGIHAPDIADIKKRPAVDLAT